MSSTASSRIGPGKVHEAIRRHMIGDGFPLVVDLVQSRGSYLVDAETGARYLDFYSFFASLPLGFHHAAFHVPENAERLLLGATHKPSNSDAHSVELATFVDSFARRAMKPPFRHLFFIEGGTLAVENALKTAFDWKVRRNIAAGRPALGSRVVHFRQAFHGRSGYTLSLTNTTPAKTDHFPKFDWPRVRNPKLRFPLGQAEVERVAEEEAAAIREIRDAFARHPHDIAAIIIEPIQCEGGDNHFRSEFLRALRSLADEGDALLVLDEVQTGFGMTGRFWAYEHFGVTPDIVCFGKKSQVCGIMAGPRVDEVPDNVFRVSSRLNSTWGGNLVDMIRCEIILEVMEAERLVENASKVGEHLLRSLRGLETRFHAAVSNVRGRGLLSAFDCPSPRARDALIVRAREKLLLVLPCGEASIRLRPPLNVSSGEVDEAVEKLADAIRAG
ncbi:MAG TPA: L-lysine 6-transaminase [Planctomycetota bacterium]|nr:L-lysine 6-transaminase [Planctomycetota bacterium]